MARTDADGRTRGRMKTTDLPVDPAEGETIRLAVRRERGERDRSRGIVEGTGRAALGKEISDSDTRAPSRTSQTSTTSLVGGSSEVGEDFTEGRIEARRTKEEWRDRMEMLEEVNVVEERARDLMSVRESLGVDSTDVGGEKTSA